MLVPFIVLATLNSGGYRYGASDQAFYQPAVLEQLDPALFPRDTPVLAAQTHLTLADDVVASVVRVTGLSVPATFAALYVAALAAFAAGVWLIGIRLYASAWTTVALLAAFTLRHAIARSGTNTLEGYFQPRLLAYGLGALAIAAFLRGRLAVMAGLLVAGAVVHPTTAVWFGVWLVVAAVIHDRRLRVWGLALAVVAATAGAWALTSGPLAGRLGVMDPEWKRMLATKTYLFPLEWPAYAWVVNLGYLPVIAWLFHRRDRHGLAEGRERPLVLGVTALFAIFVGALACHAAGITLAFQLQPARIFWMFDFLATIYVVGAIAEGASFRRRASRHAPAVLASILVVVSAARGVFVLVQAERRPVQLAIRDDDWGRVMAWARTTDKASGWLADPLHAVRYGTSVRVAGERDVFVEAVKDAALGMYDRRIAVRTDERLRALPHFDGLSAETARALGHRYDLDYLVTEGTLALPLAFESGALRVYRLR
jgi:MFS family permease